MSSVKTDIVLLEETSRSSHAPLFSFRSHIRRYKNTSSDNHVFALERLSENGYRFYRAYGPLEESEKGLREPITIDDSDEFGDDLSWPEAQSILGKAIEEIYKDHYNHDVVVKFKD